MIRDINGLNSPQVGSGQTRSSKADNAQQTAATAKNNAAAEAQQAPKAQDTVQISAQARALSQLEGRIKQLPDVNEKRVAELKSAIENGSYKVDSNSVAGKILADDQDFE